MITYIINLRRDEAKRRNILAQTARYASLDTRLIEAVDGRQPLAPDRAALADFDGLSRRHGWYKATPPAMGCALSHRLIYNQIANEGHPALILEDDAVISPDIESVIGHVEKMLAVDEPMVVLLTPHYEYHKSSRRRFIDHVDAVTVTDALMTWGYAINPAGARLLLQVQTPVTHLADDWRGFIEVGLRVDALLPHFVIAPEEGEITSAVVAALGRSRLRRLRGFIGRAKGMIVRQLHRLRGYRYYVSHI